MRLGLQFIEAHRESGQAAAQARKVDLVLVGPEVGHQRPSQSWFTAGIAAEKDYGMTRGPARWRCREST